MSENGNNWDKDWIRSEFLPFEAQEILSIPLSSRRLVDTRIWKETKNGVYSMKSAYRLLAKTATNNQPGPSSLVLHTNFWSSIWRINIPNKIKHFLWRLVLNHYQRRETLLVRKSLLMLLAISTMTILKMPFMFCGTVVWSKKYGGKKIYANHISWSVLWVFRTSSWASSKLRTPILLSDLLISHGAFGTKAMLFELVHPCYPTHWSMLMPLSASRNSNRSKIGPWLLNSLQRLSISLLPPFPGAKPTSMGPFFKS